MNKKAIINTAIAFWCDEDKCFIVQSPLMEAIIGAGDTVEEANREFLDILSDAYEAYLEGRMSNEKPGRPSKNRLALNTDVKSETREGIKKLSADLECSQGEVIDCLFSYFLHREDAVYPIGIQSNSAKSRLSTKENKTKRINYQSVDSVSHVSEPAFIYESINELSKRLSKVESILSSKASTNKPNRRSSSNSKSRRAK